MNSENFLRIIKKNIYDFIGSLSLKDKPKDKKEIEHNKKVFFIYLIGLAVVFSLICFCYSRLRSSYLYLLVF